jgi:hypothetical protein
MDQMGQERSSGPCLAMTLSSLKREETNPYSVLCLFRAHPSIASPTATAVRWVSQLASRTGLPVEVRDAAGGFSLLVRLLPGQVPKDLAKAASAMAQDRQVHVVVRGTSRKPGSSACSH